MGSISGIALSIVVGGVGSIFWIWVSSFILSIYTYIETKVGIKYREKRNDNNIGGAQIYVEKELKKKRLAKIYSLLIIFTYLIAFIMIQSNTIIISLNNNFKINKILIMFILILLVIICTKKGIQSISKTVSVLVPIMGILYIALGLFITIKYLNTIPNILNNILLESLKMKSIFSIPLIVGFQRSIFSNEIGMGATSMVVALSESSDYKSEAKLQLISTYFISLIICTISALIILTTNASIFNSQNINGIEIINYAFVFHFGVIGSYLSSIIILLFAFSTIMTSFYYGETTINYIFNNKKNTISLIIVIIVIVFSTFSTTENIWSLVDISTALMTLINIYALIKIRKKIKED